MVTKIIVYILQRDLIINHRKTYIQYEKLNIYSISSKHHLEMSLNDNAKIAISKHFDRRNVKN